MSKSRQKSRTFIEKFLEGEVSADDIDDYVDAWHAGTTDTPIYQFLGLSKEEYTQWLRDPGALTQIAQSRRERKSPAKVVSSRS